VVTAEGMDSLPATGTHLAVVDEQNVVVADFVCLSVLVLMGGLTRVIVGGILLG
jgi:hypothetical protein